MYVRIRFFLRVMSLNHSLEKQKQNEKLQETTKELSSLETERDEIRSRLRKLREVVAPLREIVAEGSNKNNDSTLDNLRTSVVSVRSLSLTFYLSLDHKHTTGKERIRRRNDKSRRGNDSSCQNQGENEHDKNVF